MGESYEVTTGIRSHKAAFVFNKMWNFRPANSGWDEASGCGELLFCQSSVTPAEEPLSPFLCAQRKLGQIP